RKPRQSPQTFFQGRPHCLRLGGAGLLDRRSRCRHGKFENRHQPEQRKPLSRAQRRGLRLPGRRSALYRTSLPGKRVSSIRRSPTPASSPKTGCKVLPKGFRVGALGGGTALPPLPRGLKLPVAPRHDPYPTRKRPIVDLAAIVTVTDDGGSSGRLRRENRILPPGDIRNCMVALSKDEALLSRLFQYRFSAGNGLIGHNFGNLFLAALTHVTGDFAEAVRVSSKVLAIRGRIFPSTVSNVHLVANLANGKRVRGETNISRSSVAIRKLELVPRRVRPLSAAVEAIREADLIL